MINRTCSSGKVPYDDKKAAVSMINYIKKHPRKGSRYPKRCYRCPECKKYHLSSDSKEKGKKAGSIILMSKFADIINRQTMDKEIDKEKFLNHLINIDNKEGLTEYNVQFYDQPMLTVWATNFSVAGILAAAHVIHDKGTG